MISQINNIITLFKDFSDYIRTDVELTKLKAVDKASDLASSLFTALLIFAAGLVFVFMASIALSLFIGHLLGKYEWGFLIVAGLWALICLVLYLIRARWPANPVRDIIVKKILD